jgi:hypothetical protein
MDCRTHNTDVAAKQSSATNHTHKQQAIACTCCRVHVCQAHPPHNTPHALCATTPAASQRVQAAHRHHTQQGTRPQAAWWHAWRRTRHWPNTARDCKLLRACVRPQSPQTIQVLQNCVALERLQQPPAAGGRRPCRCNKRVDNDRARDHSCPAVGYSRDMCSTDAACLMQRAQQEPWRGLGAVCAALTPPSKGEKWQPRQAGHAHKTRTHAYQPVPAEKAGSHAQAAPDCRACPRYVNQPARLGHACQAQCAMAPCMPRVYTE